MLYILAVCPAQTIFRLFAQFICARKEQLHYFQLPQPLPEFEFATVDVWLDASIRSSGNAFTENYLGRKQNLNLGVFLVGCFMSIFHKRLISFIILELLTDFKFSFSNTVLCFVILLRSDFFKNILSQNTNVKPSHVVLSKVILVLLK